WESDAPAEQFTRLGIPQHDPPTTAHQRAGPDRERAVAIAEPLPPATQLAARDVLAMPLVEVLRAPRLAAVVRRCTPDLAHTEPVHLRAPASLLELAAAAMLTAGELRALDEGFRGVCQDGGNRRPAHRSAVRTPNTGGHRGHHPYRQRPLGGLPDGGQRQRRACVLTDRELPGQLAGPCRGRQ